MQSTQLIDDLICAQLPDPLKYPLLYETVTKFMIHGPCGIATLRSPCMQNGRCTKFYPKKFVDETYFDEDGFPIYRRHDTSVTISVKDTEVDNRYVVPYNPKLLMKYHTHMNLEFCNKSNSIKYLFKYTNKSLDRVTVETSRVESNEEVDESKQYYDCRHLSTYESVWRIFAYDIHHRWPPVQRLIFHLPNEQSVLFNDEDNLEQVVEDNTDNTMFIVRMEAN